MAIVMNWESKTAGEFETAGGSWRIVPEGRGYVLIDNKSENSEGMRFKTLAGAQEWPRVRESEQDIFTHKVTKAFGRAPKMLQKRLRSSYPVELELIALIADDGFAYEPQFSRDSYEKFNSIAQSLGVAERL